MCRFQIIICVLILRLSLFAQTTQQLQNIELAEYKPVLLPIPEQSVYPGEELVVKLSGYNRKGTGLVYSFTWSLGGEIDQEKGEFRWTPTEKDIGNHPIIFTATDTVTHQQVHQPAIITVKAIQYPPNLEIKSNRPLPAGFLVLNELEDLALVIEASDRNETDELKLDYYVDNDFEKKINSARFEVNDRVATFLWTPTDRDAKKKSYNITFYAEDNAGLRAEKTLHVLVRDISHPPVFRTKTKEYYIDEGEILSFSIHATDEDGDHLTYKVFKSDIKLNDFYFDPETGKFQWKPTYEYANKKTDYTIIFSAQDNQHTVYDTIRVKVDPKNYPPVMEDIRERNVRENEEVVIRLVVHDKNGDENLSVDVVQSDIEDYEFDSQNRIFKWTPPFTFVNGSKNRKVQVKFRVSDGKAEDIKTASITVWDRDDPREILKSYSKSLKSARELSRQVGIMQDNLQFTYEKRKYWNTIFDISTIVVGAFTGLASSNLVSESFQKAAIPIGSTITALFGVRSVLDKSTDKIADLKTRMLILHENIEMEINSMIRDYGENPSLATTDSYAFKKDFENFKQKIEDFEAQSNQVKKKGLIKRCLFIKIKVF